MPSICWWCGCIGDGIVSKSADLTRGDLLGPAVGGRPYNTRRKADNPADQGSTRSIGRRPKGRPNLRMLAARKGRERVDGEGDGNDTKCCLARTEALRGPRCKWFAGLASKLPPFVASTASRRGMANPASRNLGAYASMRLRMPNAGRAVVWCPTRRSIFGSQTGRRWGS